MRLTLPIMAAVVLAARLVDASDLPSVALPPNPRP
jgi:hypothetical protein